MTVVLAVAQGCDERLVGPTSDNHVAWPEQNIRSLRRLIRSDPEALRTVDIVFFLLANVYGPQAASDNVERVLQFGTLGSILAEASQQLRRPIPELAEFWDLCEAVRVTIQSIAAHKALTEGFCLKQWSDLEQYLLTTMGHRKIQACRLLLLDPENRLIADELHSEGTVDKLAIYPRKILERVLFVGASGLVIIHQTPTSRIRISESDVDMARSMETVMAGIAGVLLDHVIVGGSHMVSMRRLGHLGV